MRKQIKCVVADGLLPSEKVAKIRRVDGGFEEVAVSGTLVKNDFVDAFEIGRRGSEVLIELPVESASGNWRVWVTEDAVR